MQDELEVAFCDLCNTSVPLQDLEAGLAMRHGGKTIGACCLPSLQRSPAAAAAASPAAPAAPFGDTRIGDNRLLTVAFVLLVAIAGATIYLEYRLNERVDSARASTKDVVDELDRSVRSQDDLLRGLDTAVAASAKREEVQRVGDRLGAIESALGEDRARQQVVVDRQQTTLAQLESKLQALTEARSEQKLLLGQLQTQLQQQSVTLAELRAQPRSAAKEAAAEVPGPGAATPPAAPGLPAELSHQVGRLADPDPATRFEAVDELPRSKNQAVREFLLPMTKDADTFVRRLTVEGLREFKHASCVDALLVALADPEEIVRDTAWRSLKELTGQKFPFEASNSSKDARARAQQRWQEWWDKNKATFGS